MESLETIERLLQDELKGLCTNCALASHCFYRKATYKTIIQCELYQLSDATDAYPAPAQHSLCMNCGNADTCKLPGKSSVIWHCEEYI